MKSNVYQTNIKFNIADESAIIMALKQELPNMVLDLGNVNRLTKQEDTIKNVFKLFFPNITIQFEDDKICIKHISFQNIKKTVLLQQICAMLTVLKNFIVTNDSHYYLILKNNFNLIEIYNEPESGQFIWHYPIKNLLSIFLCSDIVICLGAMVGSSYLLHEHITDQLLATAAVFGSSIVWLFIFVFLFIVKLNWHNRRMLRYLLNTLIVKDANINYLIDCYNLYLKRLKIKKKLKQSNDKIYLTSGFFNKKEKEIDDLRALIENDQDNILKIISNK